MLRKSISTMLLSLIVFAAGPKPTAADDTISWDSYMQSASVVAAIASAIASVDHCSVRPLLIEEIASGENKRTLVFTCNGNEDEEASAILHLERFGTSPWLPMKFDYAG